MEKQIAILVLVALLVGCGVMIFTQPLVAQNPEPETVVPAGYILVPATYPEEVYEEGIRMSCMYRKTRYWLAEGAGILAPEIAAEKCANYHEKIYRMYGEFDLEESLRTAVPVPPLELPISWGRRWGDGRYDYR